jgi:hypothetical protein
VHKHSLSVIPNVLDHLLLEPGKPYRRGKLRTFDLLVLTSLDQLLLCKENILPMSQAILMRRSTVLEPFPLVGVPCTRTLVAGTEVAALNFFLKRHFLPGAKIRFI